jgi:hypothetical protein
VKEGGRFEVSAALAIFHLSRYYLDTLRFDWDERKRTSAVGPSMEFGLKKPRAFSVIGMRGYSMIQNIQYVVHQRKKTGSSFSA